jgi:hypothetical protein
MSDDVDRPPTRELDHFVLWFGICVAVVAIILIVTGEWPSAVGALTGFIVALIITRRVRNLLRRRRDASSSTSGIWVFAGVETAMGAVIILIGRLVGGDFIAVVSVAIGSFLISLSLLFCTAITGITTSRR